MDTPEIMEIRPLANFREIFFLVLALFLLLIPRWTCAHSPTLQEPKKFSTDHFLPSNQITEKFLCLEETTLSSQCLLSLAKRSAREIINVDSQNFANLFIAISQSDLDSPNSVNQTIAKITNPPLRGIALTYLAQLHLRQENRRGSIYIMTKAQNFSNTSPQAYVNAWLNILIGDLLAILGRSTDSQNFVEQALQTIPLIKEHNTRSELYALAAQARLKNGQRTEAKEIIRTAMMEAKKVRDPYLKSLAFSFNALAYHRLGLLPYSISTQAIAEEYAQSSSLPSKVVALAFLSSIQAKTEQVESASRSLKKTIEILSVIRSPYHRALSFAFLAQTIYFAEKELHGTKRQVPTH
tara:strand:- start:230 stop:1288 length:1059 start_codon:yes stop_codon:yes gene_type:complete